MAVRFVVIIGVVLIIRHVAITNRVGEFTRKKGAERVTMGIPLQKKKQPSEPTTKIQVMYEILT